MLASQASPQHRSAGGRADWLRYHSCLHFAGSAPSASAARGEEAGSGAAQIGPQLGSELG